MKKLIVYLLIVYSFSTSAWAGQYVLDADHSSVSFKIKHLFSWVRGTFNDFEGSFVYDPEDASSWKVEATIQTSSIDTRNSYRDKHLRNKDFFEVDTYPTITFKSSKVTKNSETDAKVEGILSLHGIEKNVTLNLAIHGSGKDPWGNTLVGMTATTSINRKDFGLDWNQVVESGGVLVGDEVEITIDIEGVLQS